MDPISLELGVVNSGPCSDFFAINVDGIGPIFAAIKVDRKFSSLGFEHVPDRLTYDVVITVIWSISVNTHVGSLDIQGVSSSRVVIAAIIREE